MIINALYRYYQTLLREKESVVPEPGYSIANVSHCLTISGDGKLLNIIDLRDTSGRNMVSKAMVVPEQHGKRSGQKPPPNFMCDNCAYVLGLVRNENENKEKIKSRFESFKELHEEILGEVEDEGAKALLSFLNEWDPVLAEKQSVVSRFIEDLAEGSSLVFKLEGTEGYIHERQAIREAWYNYLRDQVSEFKGQCLVTGEDSNIARLHPPIKKVVGAQSSGASIVSFNQDAFTSYGKTQSFNAPVSEEAAFGYTTALNYLLDNPRHHIRIGDTTIVFWAESSSNGLEEDLLGALFAPEPEEKSEGNDKQQRDTQTEALLKDIFKRIKHGSQIKGELSGINDETNFYILGLAPNASRLSVRFWHMDSYGNYLEKISQHYRDLSIIKNYENDPDFIPVRRLLLETAPRREADRIAPLLGGAIMRSILSGQPYPMMLYNSVIIRIRAEKKVNYVLASMIKAFWLRKLRFDNRESEVEVTVSLNKENRNTGYLLGRLFALLEKTQSNANPGINSTIRDSYFGAASATPKSVFPLLLRLSQHHISKAEYGFYSDKQIEEIMSFIDGFPAHLNLEDQGQFFLGYYHQRKALYTKSEEKESVK